MKHYLVIFSLLMTLSPLSARAGGIPVFDAANLQQTTLSAIEAVNQTLKQIEEYALQLQQYEDQIKNSIAPAAYVWDQAQRTMNKIIALQDQLDYYTNQAGDLDTYMRKFGSASSYRNSPYFKASTPENKKALLDARTATGSLERRRGQSGKHPVQGTNSSRPPGSNPVCQPALKPPGKSAAPATCPADVKNRCGKRQRTNNCRP